jgi:ComF family protein
MKKILNFLTYLLFPKTCSCCGKNLSTDTDKNICDQCFKTFPKNDGLKCAICSMPLNDGGEHCYDCKHSKIYFNLLKTPYVYKGNIQKLIHKFKYSNRLFLSKDLADPMIDLIYKENWDKEIDLIIPIPLHFIKKFLRGYNQTYLLSRHISSNLHKPLNDSILLRTNYTKPQFGLNRKDRNENLKNSFTINKKYLTELKGKNILLVDDIATTCATANICAKLLKDAGAKKVFVIAIARTDF